MCPNPNLPVPDDFTPVPSTRATTHVSAVESIDASTVDVLAVVVPAEGELPSELGDLDRDGELLFIVQELLLGCRIRRQARVDVLPPSRRRPRPPRRRCSRGR